MKELLCKIGIHDRHFSHLVLRGASEKHFCRRCYEIKII